MITVKVTEKKKDILQVIISGHADSGPYGYDLVCAGVSAVSFGAVNAVYRLTNLKLIIEQKDDGGYLDISFPKEVTDNQWKKAQLLLKGMIVSLETIEEQYGEHIQIKYT